MENKFDLPPDNRFEDVCIDCPCYVEIVEWHPYGSTVAPETIPECHCHDIELCSLAEEEENEDV